MEEFHSVQCRMLIDSKIAILSLNRPDKANAMDQSMWTEIPKALKWLDQQDCRAVVLSGNGKHFCAGIDIEQLGSELLQTDNDTCQGRSRLSFHNFVHVLQDAMTSCENFKYPIIAAIHGCCYGAGIDLITCCDIRYSTHCAKFSVLEVDRAIVADMGTLSRLPGIVGDGMARDLVSQCIAAFTFVSQQKKRC